MQRGNFGLLITQIEQLKPGTSRDLLIAGAYFRSPPTALGIGEFELFARARAAYQSGTLYEPTTVVCVMLAIDSPFQGSDELRCRRRAL